jgi:hypothetical protein
VAYLIGGPGEINKLDNTHSPVLNLKFDGDLDDSSGNALNASRSNGAEDVFARHPNGSQFLVFDGATDYQVGNNALLEITGDMTAIVGFRLLYQAHGSSSGTYQNLFRFRGTGGTSTDNALYMGYLAHPNTQHYYPAWLQEHSAHNMAAYSISNYGIEQDGDWICWVCRRDSDNVTFFVNGSDIGTSSSLTTATDGSASILNIGASESGTQRLLGAMHQLTIYSSALTDAQCQERTTAMYGWMRP